MGKWFKTKEEKLAELEANFKLLVTEHEDIYNSYCKSSEYIFLFKGFEIIDGEIYVLFVDFKTTTGYISEMPYQLFKYRLNNESILKSRIEWINFREKLNRIGIELKTIQNEKETTIS